MQPYHLSAANFSAADYSTLTEIHSNNYITVEVQGEGEIRLQGPNSYKCVFFYVDAQVDDYIVLSISCSLPYKLWINKCFNGISPEQHSIMEGEISKGRNLIVLEFLEPASTFSFSCRISFSSYEEQPFPDRLLYHNLYIENARVTLDVK